MIGSLCQRKAGKLTRFLKKGLKPRRIAENFKGLRVEEIQSLYIYCEEKKESLLASEIVSSKYELQKITAGIEMYRIQSVWLRIKAYKTLGRYKTIFLNDGTLDNFYTHKY